MILKRIALILLALASTCAAQLKSVMVDDSGVVQRPVNFWNANGQLNANRRNVTFANLSTHTSQGGMANVTNSQASFTLESTNANSSASIRLMQTANGRPSAGAGTIWAGDSHAFWCVIDVIPRGTDVLRFVAGNSTVNTNYGIYPTNRAVGFEISLAGESGGVGTNRLRLIAHNGSSATNGPWVNIGNWFDWYTIGVQQNKTNGEIRVSIGLNGLSPTLITNATIMGGPTNNGAAGLSAWEAGMFSTQTNGSGGAGAGIYSAWMEITQ
jgi:hypothetical protein